MQSGPEVLGALQRQGFSILQQGRETVIMTPDTRRVHKIPSDAFDGHDEASKAALRRIVAGLGILEGFTAPPGFWQD